MRAYHPPYGTSPGTRAYDPPARHAPPVGPAHARAGHAATMTT
ncbi:hypothetical protein RCO28_06705 [Streptomyces sp. LHD-70]|nr:hypothetical protein [Streptomyces sp. LHD-70]MDQ8702183.1 hypothetical protein [Streptomyces sp. LHD-70]